MIQNYKLESLPLAISELNLFLIHNLDEKKTSSDFWALQFIRIRHRHSACDDLYLR